MEIFFLNLIFIEKILLKYHKKIMCQLLTEDNSMKNLPWNDSHETNS